jgi:hypothetical protein
MPIGEAPYGVADARPATKVIVNPNGSNPQFANPGASYSKNKRSSNQFVFETHQLSPDKPQSYSVDTSTGVFGARGTDALSNPAGRP